MNKIHHSLCRGVMATHTAVDEDGFISTFTGDISKIPEAGTLVAIDTSSRGLVNCVTTGKYSLRKSPVDKFYKPYDEEEDYRECSSEGEFLVSVEVRYVESGGTNSRWLDALHFPVLAREVKDDL